MWLHQCARTDNCGTSVHANQLSEDGNSSLPLSEQAIRSNRNKLYTELLWCRSPDAGPRNTIVAVHPGLLRTELARKWLHNDYSPNLLQPICSPVIDFLFSKTFLPPLHAVSAVLQAATAPASKVGVSVCSFVGIQCRLLLAAAAADNHVLQCSLIALSVQMREALHPGSACVSRCLCVPKHCPAV